MPSEASTKQKEFSLSTEQSAAAQDTHTSYFLAQDVSDFIYDFGATGAVNRPPKYDRPTHPGHCKGTERTEPSPDSTPRAREVPALRSPVTFPPRHVLQVETEFVQQAGPAAPTVSSKTRHFLRLLSLLTASTRQLHCLVFCSPNPNL